LTELSLSVLKSEILLETFLARLRIALESYCVQKVYERDHAVRRRRERSISDGTETDRPEDESSSTQGISIFVITFILLLCASSWTEIDVCKFVECLSYMCLASYYIYFQWI